jgi:hypothetical protein
MFVFFVYRLVIQESHWLIITFKIRVDGKYVKSKMVDIAEHIVSQCNTEEDLSETQKNQQRILRKITFIVALHFIVRWW